MKILIYLLIIFILMGCENGTRDVHDAGLTNLTIFNADQGGRMGNLGRWYNYIQSDQSRSSGIGFPVNYISSASCFNWLTKKNGPRSKWVSSTGPWWIDPNHKMGTQGNGFGLINVIAFAQIPSALRQLVSLEGATVEFFAKTSDDFSTVYADSSLGWKKSRVYLWFQTAPRPVENCNLDPSIGEDCTRQSGYIMTSNPIDGKNKLLSFKLLGSRDYEWTCLGAGINVKYDCMAFDEAIKNVSVIGFVAAPVKACPRVDKLCAPSFNTREHFNVGILEFKGFVIKSNLFRKSNLTSIELSSNVSSVVPVPGWSTIQYGEGGRIAGLYVKIDDGYKENVRFALAKSNVKNLFDDVGFHIYLSSDSQTIFVAKGDELISISKYETGDFVGLHLNFDEMLVLKNDEIIYRDKSPCSNCMLYPLASYTNSSNKKLIFYKY